MKLIHKIKKLFYWYVETFEVAAFWYRDMHRLGYREDTKSYFRRVDYLRKTEGSISTRCTQCFTKLVVARQHTPRLCVECTVSGDNNIGYLTKLYRKTFCKHVSVDFVSNIHGDAINLHSGNRSLWKCNYCSKIVEKHYLVKITS